MWSQQYRYQIFTIFVLVYNGCDAITNADFNEQIRDYSVDNDNSTNAKTLQKDKTEISRHSIIAPVQNPVRFKEAPDNVLSGSNLGRGLLHHDHGGYGLYEYENPHYDPGYEYQPDPHDYHHYEFHDPHHHHHVADYGHHHKYHDHHALAAKTLLWPIAGIALLGAAAALVTNPVLLQLGVISGRKKRQVENLDFVKDSIKNWTPKPDINIKDKNIQEFMVKRVLIKKDDTKVKPSEVDDKHKSNFKMLTVLSRRHTDEDEKRMIPVPLLFRTPY